VCPARYLPDLAGALANLGIHYSSVGRRQDALAPAEEAVQLYREQACAEIIERWRPIGLEALDEQLIQEQAAQHMHVKDIGELPKDGSRAWLLVQFGADDEAESMGTARVRPVADQEEGVPRGSDPGHEKRPGGRPEPGHLGDPRRRPRLHRVRPGRGQLARLGGLSRPALRARPLRRRPARADETAPDQGRDVRALRPGLHPLRLSFDLRHADGIAGYRSFLEEAADLVVRYGGSLSGEHGDGQQRAELLERQYGPELIQAMREFKRIWDPDWKMNPGKVIDPYRLDENLRLGTSYNPPRPRTKFAYPEEKGDFAHATLRCVGIGKCRVPGGSPTMCPSYQVTREEKHSTRGRARLLFEMLQGEVITDGWQSREVYDALDLCLACKGCTNDCPVNVDMPTYKAEFLHHHYRSARRWRPRYAYAFGYIDKTARLASLFPELVNLATQTPGLRVLARLAAGVDKHRPLPRFAPMTLQEWFRHRGGTANPNGRPVVLFPDTFNNYLHTGVGVACVQALEAASWRVIMPDRHVCCGRPLYDYGFLDSAERYLRRVVDVLRPYLRDGVPLVRMEPSCLAVFKDELGKVLPHDDDASRLARNAYHFGEFCTAFGIEPPRLDGRAILWGHCQSGDPDKPRSGWLYGPPAIDNMQPACGDPKKDARGGPGVSFPRGWHKRTARCRRPRGQ
jgi:Fe-S oxidoreductase